MDLVLSFSFFVKVTGLGQSGPGDKMAEGSPIFKELQWKEHMN